MARPVSTVARPAHRIHGFDLLGGGVLLHLSPGKLAVRNLAGSILHDHATPYPASVVPELRLAFGPGAVVLFHTHFKPRILEYDPVADRWNFGRLGLTSVPELAGAPSISGDGDDDPEGLPAAGQQPSTHFPACGAFFQGRLLMGGSWKHPLTIWGSVSGDIRDFSITAEGQTVQDDDGFLLTSITAASIGRITDMLVSRHVVVFGIGGEGYMPGSEGVLTPHNASLRPNSAKGIARDVPAIAVEGSPVFVESNRRSVRMLTYDDNERAYASRNISLTASHLLHTPRGIEYIRGQDDTDTDYLVVINDEGDLAVMTIDKSNNIYAWTQWVTQGQYLDIAEVAGRVYALATRSGRLYLERLIDPSELDAETSASGDTATAPRHPYLVGRADLSVVADGTRYDGVTSDNEGTIIGVPAAREWQVGLRYPGDWRMRTLPYVPGGGDSGPRSGRLTKRRIFEVSPDWISAPGEMTVNGNAGVSERGADQVSRIQGLRGWTERPTIEIEAVRSAKLRGIAAKIAL